MTPPGTEITRALPPEVDSGTLWALLKHARWEVRFNAARTIQDHIDDSRVEDLLRIFEREKHPAVRHILALGLSSLHEAGISVPRFAELAHLSEATRRQLVIERLKELKVQVYSDNQGNDQFLVPHKLVSIQFIEIGYLMAQLVDRPFPEHYSPLAETVESTVLPLWSNPALDFVDSHPHGMKFRINRQPK